MQWLAAICVRRPVFATVLSVVILVVGGVFYGKLGLDQFPKVDFPVVVIVTRLPGASPADVETEISDRIEGAVNTLSGIDELRSISAEGVSQVIVQFVLEKNVDVAAQEVQQKLNTVLAELPRGIDPPVVQKFDPDSQPVLFLALNAKDKDVREITDVADRVVRRRLESLNGVGEVRILGGRKRQVNVLVDPVKLRALGISASEVGAAVGAQNMTMPGGRVDASRDYLSVRINGRLASVDALRDLVVREQAGRVVRLGDVATVADGVQDVETAARWNGEPTVLLTIRKQSGTNTVHTVDAVLACVQNLQKELPPGYELAVQRDASQVIRTSTDAVNEHLVLGALMAAVVVLLFLGNVRSTLIAALAIPTSIVGTFALMAAKGYTLNTITLLALALAVGIVIDDAIVVLESIFRLVEERGYDPQRAAIEGTREIGLAVMATTLSLIAVFLPIAFIGGIAGRFLSSFGVTMAFSIAVSLFVSFTLTPMLASRWLKARKEGAPKSVLERIVDVGYRPVESVYGGMLAFCLRRRWTVVIASIAALLSTVPLAKKAKKGFLPVDDRGQFEIIARLPEGRSAAASELIGERVARVVREMPETVATLVTVGDDEQRTPNQARIYVKLLPPEQRQATQEQIKERVRQKILPLLPKDLRVSVADVNEFGGGQSTARIQFLLSGPDLKVLEEVTPRALEKMRRIPGAVDVDTSLVQGKPELGVFIDRDRAADLGVQVAEVARALQLLVAGQKVSDYEEGGEQYEIRLRADGAFRSNEESLQLIAVPSRKVGLVSLSEVAKVVPGAGLTSILRFQRERQVTFMANAAPGYSEGAVADAIKVALESLNLPKGFVVRPQGQTKIMAETARSFAFGLLAAMLFMYLVLAAQFESWLHPVTILLTLPLTLPFAVASVIAFDQSLDLYSFLGIFVLFGVVKKNAILQIDHTNKLRERGLARFEALVQANRDRLRPILMTTFAFVAGMLPLVTAKGIGSGFSRATAGVVVGGQVLSLLLTLVAVPVAYSYFDDLAALLRRIAPRLLGAAPGAKEPRTPAAVREVRPGARSASREPGTPEPTNTADIPPLHASAARGDGRRAAGRPIWIAGAAALESGGRDVDAPRVADALTPMTFAEAQAALLDSADRDGAARALVRCAASTFERTLLFRVCGDLAMGWMAAGSSMPTQAARAIDLSLALPSAFKLVRDSRCHFLGPLRIDAATASLFQVIGGAPRTAALLPVLAAGRVVNILYGDNGPEQHATLELGELLILSQKVGRAYEALLAERAVVRASLPPVADLV